MLRAGSASHEKLPRHRHNDGMSAARRRGLSAMSVRTRYRVAYAILTACIIYLFVVGVERRLAPDVPPFESFGGEIFPMAAERGGPPAARAAHKAEQAVLGGAPARVPVPVPDGGGHKVKDGFLRVDPDARVHPIHQLIRDARRKWDAKRARQSRTLREAVDEYHSRYYQHPPKGFDKWWRYVV